MLLIANRAISMSNVAMSLYLTYSIDHRRMVVMQLCGELNVEWDL